MIYIYRSILFLCLLQCVYLVAPALGINPFLLLGIFIFSFYFGKIYNALTAGIFYVFKKPKVEVFGEDISEKRKLWFSVLDYEVANMGLFMDLFSLLIGMDFPAHFIGCHTSVKFNTFLGFKEDLKEIEKENE